MIEKQDTVVSQLLTYLTEARLELLEERQIDYGRQFRISNGTEVCSVNIYTSGKVMVGGKRTALKQQIEEWKNLTQAQGQDLAGQGDEYAAQNRTTKFVVAQAKFDRIRALLQELPAEITWREGSAGEAQLYQAEVRAGSDKVVVTQYRTSTLMVQGRASALFDLVCDQLDQKLSQSIADRATRFIPEANRQSALEQMNQPEAETKALAWLLNQMEEGAYHFLYPHDRETLLSGVALTQAVRAINLKLPDYSVLVMPFARAYEGFLVKLFIHLALADAEEIEQNVRAIQVGRWLDELPALIVDPFRHGHLVSDLKTAWEGSRHLALHSDHVRQAKMATFEEAEHEICGVILRAVRRGFESLVARPIKLKRKEAIEAEKKTPEKRTQQLGTDEIKVEGINETSLLKRLAQGGYTVEYLKETEPTKWRVLAEHWRVFCPREPGDMIIVRGPGREDFLAWLHGEAKAEARPALPAIGSLEAHIGVDEAGKGDYFGPLTVAAVHVTPETALELIRLGVRDSKNMSDAVIADLALKIRERCANVVQVLTPSEYNTAYQYHRNLNRLLAEAHASVIQTLVEKTGCRQVIADQFAEPHVLETALQKQGLKVDLEQRTKGEADVAVAAASILARESFVAAIEDFRARAEMDIPLGSSSPKVVEVGRVIVQRWGPGALERIAKLNFKTTEKILGRR